MIVAQILASKGRDVATTSPDTTISAVVAELSAAQDRRARRGRGRDRRCRDRLGAGHRQGACRARRRAARRPVGSIMTRDVVTCGESETINSVMARMTRGRFRHLPVVEGGRLAGIVSIGDVVKARIEEVEHEAEEMRTYIATQPGGGLSSCPRGRHARARFACPRDSRQISTISPISVALAQALVADVDRLGGAVEFEVADPAELRADGGGRAGRRRGASGRCGPG